MRLVLPLLLLAVLALAAYAPSPAPTARPAASADTSEWENLLVLPDTLSRDELRDIMRGFSRALGVRCNHCHVREGEDFDFASDAKPEKEVARGMIGMTWEISHEILPAMGPAFEAMHEAEEEAHEHEGAMHEGEMHEAAVVCWTCHRGETHPAEPPPPPPEEEHGPPPHDGGSEHQHNDGHAH